WSIARWRWSQESRFPQLRSPAESQGPAPRGAGPQLQTRLRRAHAPAIAATADRHAVLARAGRDLAGDLGDGIAARRLRTRGPREQPGKGGTDEQCPHRGEFTGLAGHSSLLGFEPALCRL